MRTREYVLALLEKNRGRHISGEELAGALGVSRTAVWKAIRDLKAEGFPIAAVTNKGYSLSPDSAILSVQGMLPFLRDPGLAEKIHLLSQVESTNSTAHKMVLEGAGHRTVVLAGTQTLGRGRRGRSFYSPPDKGVYMSVVLRPKTVAMADAALITTAASVAVCRAIEDATGRQAQIKWVNDVYLEGKKVCGILTEAITDFESGDIAWIILGVGVNFSTLPEEFPPELQGRAGSVCPGSGDGALRNRLAAELVNQLVELESWLENRRFLEEYRSRSMVLGRRIEVLTPGKNEIGTAVDIDANGHLVVQWDNGGTEALSAGEITIHPID